MEHDGGSRRFTEWINEWGGTWVQWVSPLSCPGSLSSFSSRLTQRSGQPALLHKDFCTHRRWEVNSMALSSKLSICSAFLPLSYSNWNLTIPWRHCIPGSLTSGSYFSYTLSTNGPRAEIASLILISFQTTNLPLLPLSTQLLVLPTRIPACCSHLPTLVITFIHQRC